MRCRFKHKIFQNEENGYTIAIFTTQDTSVPLSARDKYLASRNIIGFSAIGFGLPLTDEIELEMEGRACTDRGKPPDVSENAVHAHA